MLAKAVGGAVNVYAIDDTELTPGLCIDDSSVGNFTCEGSYVIPENKVNVQSLN